jgi:hypothetical protein
MEGLRMTDQDTLQFEVVKHVTLPLIKLGIEPSFIRFDGPMYQSEKATPTRARSDGEEPKGDRKAPPILAEVTDMVHDIKGQMICNTVLETELKKKYKDDSYVGHIFRLVKTKLQGRDYATFEITEVKLKTAAPATGKK